MDKFLNCTEVSKNKHITLSDHGRKVSVLNPSKKPVSKITFDNCVIKNEPAADYLVAWDHQIKVIFELKGRNVEHAIDQIYASACKLKELNLDLTGTIGAIFCKQVPSGSTTINRRKGKLLADHKIKTSISSSRYCFNIETLNFE